MFLSSSIEIGPYPIPPMPEQFQIIPTRTGYPQYGNPLFLLFLQYSSSLKTTRKCIIQNSNHNMKISKNSVLITRLQIIKFFNSLYHFVFKLSPSGLSLSSKNKPPTNLNHLYPISIITKYMI